MCLHLLPLPHDLPEIHRCLREEDDDQQGVAQVIEVRWPGGVIVNYVGGHLRGMQLSGRADAPKGLPLKVLLLGTGSEVHLAMEAREALAKQKIGARVVSLPCWEAFEAQPQAYRDKVIPPRVSARVGVEASISLGWDRYLGDKGVMVGMKGFGGSAPFDSLHFQVLRPR